MKLRFFGIFSALGLAIVAAATIAFAATSPTIESTPIPGPPKPDFSAMKFLLGNWTCSTKSSRRPSAYTTTSTASIDPTGYWMVTKSVQHKTSWVPQDLSATDMTTYDADAHRWVDVLTGDWGGYNVSTSPGWHGISMVWTDAVISPQGNVASTTPTIVTKVSDTKTTARNTFKEKSGRTITVDTVCKKTS